MKALLLSAYDAESHRLWRGSLRNMFPAIEWKELVLPARYFSWRVRGNSVSWAFNHRDELTDNYDFLLATSMTDLSALRGFVPALGALPTVVYFHENQFAYPANRTPGASAQPPVESQILSIYSALCANRIVFNSHYNRNSFLAGAAQLLRKLPDHVPPNLMRILEQATVLPVPLNEDVFVHPARNAQRAEPDVLNIVWNHRREYDKGPELLLAIVEKLVVSGLRFRLHLLGQRFRQSPAPFARIESLLGSYYSRQNLSPGQTGYLEERSRYCDLLGSSDVVLSTSLHDFQGLSVLEGAALGCTPLVPQRLVYPEYFPPECCYPAAGELAVEAESALRILCGWAALKAGGGLLPKVDVLSFRQSLLHQDYAALIRGLTSQSRAI